MVSASDHTNYVSISNQKSMTQLVVINLHPNKYCEEFLNDSFAFKLGRCVEIYSTLNVLSNNVCVPNRRFKSKRFQDNYRNKLIENINKVCLIQM